MESELYQRRGRVRDALRRANLDGVLIGPSSDWGYLTGLPSPIPTRLSLLVLPVDGEAELVTPLLEAPGTPPAGLALRTWTDGEDPVAATRSALEAAGLARARIGVAPQVWSRYLLPLIEQTKATFLDATTVLQDVRCIKSEAEIEALARAAAAADRAVTSFQAVRFAGRSEAEIGSDFARLLTEAGHDHVDFVIVGSGPNGANPHHSLGPRQIEPGDVIVVDVGGTVAGFHSDITRMFAVGEPGDEVREVHELVRRAHAAAQAHVRPGVTAESVDAEARAVIAAAGLGDRFIHRLGHGLGIDEHEAPYLVAGETRPLAPGMVFSIEPGVYLPGRFGIRIEDVYVCTEDGAERLGRLSQDLILVA